jgi:hypothetical protein
MSRFVALNREDSRDQPEKHRNTEKEVCVVLQNAAQALPEFFDFFSLFAEPKSGNASRVTFLPRTNPIDF